MDGNGILMKTFLGNCGASLLPANMSWKSLSFMPKVTSGSPEGGAPEPQEPEPFFRSRKYEPESEPVGKRKENVNDIQIHSQSLLLKASAVRISPSGI